MTRFRRGENTLQRSNPVVEVESREDGPKNLEMITQDTNFVQKYSNF